VYKANYKPSQLLCPVTSNFVYITEEIKKQIDSEVKPKLSAELTLAAMDVDDGDLIQYVMEAKIIHKWTQMIRLA